MNHSRAATLTTRQITKSGRYPHVSTTQPLTIGATLSGRASTIVETVM